jgi:hypothetical protein
VNVYPFIEVERDEQRNVKRACALLKVSRAAFYDWIPHPSSVPMPDCLRRSRPSTRTARRPTDRRACTPSCGPRARCAERTESPG